MCKVTRLDLKIRISEYDVMHDALEVLCYKNLKRPRNSSDIGTDRNLAKNHGTA